MNEKQLSRPVYETPEIELQRFDEAAIVCTSPEANFNSAGEEDFGGTWN